MSKQRAKLAVGNWKMHGRPAENAALLQAVAHGAGQLPADVPVGVCAPSPYLAQTQSLLEGICVVWGVQDVPAFTYGAHTGEVAAPMVVELAASLATVGHSERLAHHRVRAELVAAQSQRFLYAVLPLTVCACKPPSLRQPTQT
ncbi:triose-phosphate isomerase, partial [Paraburkholderia ginsengiterrae]|uniref:triose-phosphate isomerase n=1 Tax=Paraburkholderia ginsengiterrae TaxID=1462993 RepID=UPI001ABFB16E